MRSLSRLYSLACTLPCQRFTGALASDHASLGVDVVRYAFIVSDCTLYSLPVSRRTSD